VTEWGGVELDVDADVDVELDDSADIDAPGDVSAGFSPAPETERNDPNPVRIGGSIDIELVKRFEAGSDRSSPVFTGKTCGHTCKLDPIPILTSLTPTKLMLDKCDCSCDNAREVGAAVGLVL
jgi:hypothetical protein